MSPDVPVACAHYSILLTLFINSLCGCQDPCRAEVDRRAASSTTGRPCIPVVSRRGQHGRMARDRRSGHFVSLVSRWVRRGGLVRSCSSRPSARVGTPSASRARRARCGSQNWPRGRAATGGDPTRSNPCDRRARPAPTDNATSRGDTNGTNGPNAWHGVTTVVDREAPKTASPCNDIIVIQSTKNVSLGHRSRLSPILRN